MNSSKSLSDLLRKCRILAQRIDNEEFKGWVVSELDGYRGNDIPDYRRSVAVIVLASYFGAFGRQMTNFQLPQSAVPDNLKELFFTAKFFQGVGELEQLLTGSSKNLRMSVPTDALQFVGEAGLADDFVLAEAVRLVDIGVVRGILEAIRNRILNFTLELESLAGNAGDPMKKLREEKRGDVSREFHLNVFGNVSNLNQGGDNAVQVGGSVRDLRAFERTLSDGGLPNGLVKELSEAVAQEEPSPGGLGPKAGKILEAFIAGMKAAGEKIGIGVVTNLVSKAALSYYGAD